jgi:hypothetical protein
MASVESNHVHEPYEDGIKVVDIEGEQVVLKRRRATHEDGSNSIRGNLLAASE